MLEKLITNLKNSLPESIRKKLGGESEVEDDEEEQSGADELQRYESDDGEPSADEAAEKKKKQISMLIRVVLILGLAYLAVDQFVLSKKSEPSVDDMLASMPVKKNKKSKKVLAEEAAAAAAKAAEATAADPAKTAEAGADATANSSATTDATTAATDTSASMDVPPIENVNILDKNETASGSNPSPEAQMNIETPATEIVSSKTVDTSVDNKIDQLVENVEQSTPPVVSSSSSNDSLSAGTSEPEEINIPSQPRQSVGQSTMAEPKPKKDTSMASKIVEVATETPAPAYDQVGRGLVYNCKDKYWACVDKPAYLLCNRNMKWNKSKGNSMECVVSDIYNTDEDCAKVQKYNVSMSVATTFCQ